MKQVFQSLKTGETSLTDVPAPQVKPGHVLIRTRNSLISAGTERMLVEFGKANLLDKARQQPEKVLQMLDKIRTDGLLPTLDAVKSKLDSPLPLGYCNAGVVIGVGEGVEGIKPGDRVASNGPHAEIVCVPKNLCAKIPGDVDDEAAAFTVAGAIALQSVRLAKPELGETIVVTGLGLIGLLVVQLLRASGCRVLAIDFNDARLSLAGNFGAEVIKLTETDSPINAAMQFSRGLGVDAVIIAASTKSSKPLQQAAEMCRVRGRVVLVGAVGMELKREPLYQKEITVQVSCSYGPGRYDPSYEEEGNDYPLGYVRWTEQRNLEAFLLMLAQKRVDITPLITHRYALEKTHEAYKTLTDDNSALGILLQYPVVESEEVLPSKISMPNASAISMHKATKENVPTLGWIGAGNYAQRILLPAFDKVPNSFLKTIVSRGGDDAALAGKKYGFHEATTEVDDIFKDEEIDAVVITTRHDSHAELVCKALRAGKHVFVEKPLAITPEGLNEIKAAYEDSKKKPLLMAGFNRRFAPQIIKIKKCLANEKAPKAMVATMNAGKLPSNHWLLNPDIGGGRILGEACHYIDLLRFLAGTEMVSVKATPLGDNSSSLCQSATIILSFADGSIGTLHYLANGHGLLPKERLEVFCGGKVFQLDNYRRLRGYGVPGFKKMNLWRQDKGQGNCAKEFVQAIVDGKESPIPYQELIEVAEVTFKALEELRR
ncbi:MAG: bi-domain-containing oxidoreductase [Planctomycetes bacterium]|nr:bi-domain-containing oxidoreductase [Planctomycetota bacterium]